MEKDTSIRLPNAWSPREHQRNLWRFLENGGKRAVVAWHRRSGKDSTAINWTACAALQRVGLYFHCAPTAAQCRKIIWDGLDGQGRRVIDQALPKQLREGANENEMRIRLVNGSVWQVVGSDNFDALVGTNPVGIVFSEYALADPQVWGFIRPILAENGGWALFISTPRGQNHFADLYEMGKRSPDWFTEVLTVEDTKCIDLDIIARERAEGMSDAMIKQEYYCSFAGAVEGAYYVSHFELAEKEKRVTHVPWEPQLPVHTAWDLGLDDLTSVWFFQRVSREIRLIDYYEASGVGLEHYVRELRSKPYSYGDHLFPHDVQVTELGSGRSRKEMLKSLGLNVKVVPRVPVEDGIQAVRSIFSQCWFDQDKCEKGIKALKAYRTEFDSKTGTTRQRPLHDWSSHAADSFRYLAVGIKQLDERTRNIDRPPVRVLRGYDKQKRSIRGTFTPPPARKYNMAPELIEPEKLSCGRDGYYIQPYGIVAGDGRQRWSVHGPDGGILTFAWGQDEAQQAAKKFNAGIGN